jgi:16S rRNA (adenine1518-N6/adenine1519-N6)-dimethyltransferase
MKIYKAKKSLGQNFLKSEAALRKIIETGEIKPSDVILEIGPGKGVLTSKLLEKISTPPPQAGAPLKRGIVIAVEKDRELFELLQEKFSEEIKSKNLILVNEDILEFKIESYKVKSYKIIANIPYNITGAILKKFLTAKEQPERMVLLVQREVAQRIVARDGKESILSISVKAYGEPKMVMKVEKRYFSPAPKVDSAIISIKNISRRTFHPGASATPQEGNFESRFWEIVKAGFAHKRKKLSSNLKLLPKNITPRDLENLGNKRAEELSLSEWISLAK